MSADDSFIGSIEMFAGNYAPVGFMICAGQTLQISQYQALYSLLGTTYGGDGRTTFALPDLRGRTPIGAGNGPTLSQRRRGQRGGQETVPLSTPQLPPHTHRPSLELQVSDDTGEKTSPANNALAALPRGMDPIYTDTSSANENMYVGGEIANTGDGHPHENMPPFLTINYIICVNGLYPPHQ